MVDVDATGARLRIARLQGATEDGARISLDGTLGAGWQRWRAAQTGKMQWSARRADGAGLLSLGELMDVPAQLRPVTERQAVILPFKLAGSATLGAQGAADALVLDGEGVAGQTQTRFAATLNGG